jgi:hypothetical protein
MLPNWFVRSAEKPIDLHSLTTSQWLQVSDRMQALGHDWNGPADAKEICLRLGWERLPDDHRRILRSVAKGEDIRPAVSPDRAQRYFQKAIKLFGLTNSLAVAGYILPDGSMLDFSGSHYGGYTKSTSRGVDHTEIGSILNSPSFEHPKTDFATMGAIRHFPEQPGVDIRKRPTEIQLNIIRFDADRSPSGYTIEIVDLNRGRKHTEYAPGTPGTKVVSDIKTFYGTP